MPCSGYDMVASVFYVRTPQFLFRKVESSNDETENDEPTHQQAKQVALSVEDWSLKVPLVKDHVMIIFPLLQG